MVTKRDEKKNGSHNEWRGQFTQGFFLWGVDQLSTVVEEQDVNLKLKGSQKELRKTPSHSCTHRELKEKTRPGGRVCGA